LTSVKVVKTNVFDKWLKGLKDRKAAIRIQIRLDRLIAGNAGDVKPIGGGLSELRIDYGPGYRVYYLRRGTTLVVLLCGGDKATQDERLQAGPQNCGRAEAPWPALSSRRTTRPTI